MGYHIAFYNAAILIDKHNVFSDLDLDIQSLKSRI